jgi:ABC-2 type transport system ATP-binding protein
VGASRAVGARRLRAEGAVIEVTGLNKRYGDFVAVRDLSFRVASGEVVGFLGVNGAGKTTTMRMITGFLPPSAGRIDVAGHDLEKEPQAARRAIGYLPEVPPLYPEMRVEDYVNFAASIKDVPRARRCAQVERALSDCGLQKVARKVIGTLSKGYRQRVGLAQAVVHEPSVLVLDEPTAGLDPIQIREIRELIHQLATEQGRTVLLSTHILPEVEAICKRVLVISAGQLRLDGSLDDVRKRGTLEDVFLRESAPLAGAPSANLTQEDAE